MRSDVLLDPSVIGLLCSSPLLPNVMACQSWLSRLSKGGTIIVVPDITLYELRREFFRIKATVKLVRLEQLRGATESAEVTPEAWLKAAEFWAFVRSVVKPTVDPLALDGDPILAGVAATIGNLGDTVTIATTNVGHLTRFPGVKANRWESIS